MSVEPLPVIYEFLIDGVKKDHTARCLSIVLVVIWHRNFVAANHLVACSYIVYDALHLGNVKIETGTPGTNEIDRLAPFHLRLSGSNHVTHCIDASSGPLVCGLHGVLCHQDVKLINLLLIG